MTTEETRHFDSDSYAILRSQIQDIIKGEFTSAPSNSPNSLTEDERKAWDKLFSLLPAYDDSHKRFVSIRVEVNIREFHNARIQS